MNKEEYKYVLYSDRPNYGSSPNFIRGDAAPESGGFTSLYAVDESTAQAIQSAGTAKNFKGVVWSERLWIDVDSYEAADTTERKLKEMGYAFISYESGGRGAHFGVLRTSDPSHLLPLQDKAFVREHFPEADATIYTHLHPFRLPGTLHNKTGRPKRFVSQAAGKPIELPPYRDEVRSVGRSEVFAVSGQTKSIFDIHFIQRNSEASKEGERHAHLVRLIYALRDNGYDVNIARWWVNEVNKRFSPPKEEYEIEKALGSIYR